MAEKGYITVKEEYGKQRYTVFKRMYGKAATRVVEFHLDRYSSYHAEAKPERAQTPLAPVPRAVDDNVRSFPTEVDTPFPFQG